MLTNQNITKASSPAAVAVGRSAENASEKELDGSQGPRKGVRMLVILNNRRSIDAGLLFLERRGYQIVVVNRISEAIQTLQTFKPHSILLSWNLKGSDVRKTYKVLTEKFKLVCIVFAEDNSTRTTASLMSSGIPHSLLSPVSGPSIHMRVQALLRQKVGGKERRKRQVAEYAMMEPLKEKAPPDINWEQVPDPEGGDVPLWQGKSKLSNDKTYYFKGPFAPKFDSDKKSWTYNEGGQDSGAVIMKGVGRGKILSANQHGFGQGETFEAQKGERASGTYEGRQDIKTEEVSDFLATQVSPDKKDSGNVIETGADVDLGAPSIDLDDEDFDWEAALSDETNKELDDIETQMRDTFAAGPDVAASAEESPAPVPLEKAPVTTPKILTKEEEEIAKQTERLRVGSESLLFKAVKSTAGKMFHPDPDETVETIPLKVELVAFIQPIVIKSAHFKGILYVASAADQDLEKILLEFAQNIALAINNAGENGIVKVVPRIKVDPLPFRDFFRNRGDFYLQVSHFKDCLGFGFVNVSQIPKVDDVGEPEVVAVSLENDIQGGHELLFDLFIHLPRNNKFILYMNKGHTLTERTVAKFLNFGIKSVHIRKKEKDLLLSYWARNLIKTLRS